MNQNGNIEGRKELNISLSNITNLTANLDNTNGSLIGEKINVINNSGDLLNSGGVIGGVNSKELKINVKGNVYNGSGLIGSESTNNLSLTSGSSIDLGSGKVISQAIDLNAKKDITSSIGSSVTSLGDGILNISAGSNILMNSTVSSNNGIKLNAGNDIGFLGSLKTKDGNVIILSKNGSIGLGADISTGSGSTGSNGKIAIVSSKNLDLDDSKLSSGLLDISAGSDISAKRAIINTSNGVEIKLFW